MRRNLLGRFSKKQHFNLPYQENLKVILPFVYLLIIAFTGSYITEAKAFHINYIKQIYEPKQITVYPNIPFVKEDGGIYYQNESSVTEIKELTIEERIREVAIGEGFSEIDMLLKVAKCESSMNPYAINVNRDGSVDSGLFQINEYWHGADRDCHTDVECSTRKAIQIQREAGSFMPWVCYWKYNL